jgi:hypothetical protein
MRASIFSSIVLAAAAIGSAQADTVSWNTTCSSCSNYSNPGNEMTFTSGGQTLKARAFYIGVSNDSINDTVGALNAATLSIYDQGLGVHSPNESWSSPQHTTDNNGLKEMVVFQLPTNWVADSVSLYPFGTSQDTDVTFYLSKDTSSITSFSQFAGKSLNQLVNDYDFTTYDDTTSATGPRDVAVDTTATTGRWLLVASWFNSSNDYFKVKTVAGKTGTPGGGGSVPEPATLSLLAFGLCAVGAYRRRRLSSGA